jgi:hypothetical protein
MCIAGKPLIFLMHICKDKIDERFKIIATIIITIIIKITVIVISHRF